MSTVRAFAPVRSTTSTVYRLQAVPCRILEEDPKDLAVTVGRNIGAWRERCRLTQDELAWMVGCRRSSVSRWESGTRLPSLQHLVALGRALGCGAGALLPEE